jgi:DNA-binding HxlR family transcriptional regulator
VSCLIELTGARYHEFDEATDSVSSLSHSVLKRDYETQTCSVARALEVVGERWSLLILRSVFLGVHRFDDLLAGLGITRSVLTTRLQRLVDEGVVERVAYQQRPTRYEYRATAKGRELWPVVLHLLRWGDAHYPEPAGVPRLVEHAGCGGRPDDHLLCDRCGEPLTYFNTRARPGPGLTAAGKTAGGPAPAAGMISPQAARTPPSAPGPAARRGRAADGATT